MCLKLGPSGGAQAAGEEGEDEEKKKDGGERKKQMQGPKRGKNPERWSLHQSYYCKQTKKTPPNKPRHWRNGRGLLGGDATYRRDQLAMRP